MDAKIRKKLIKNEFKFRKWFEKNYKKLGYSKILRRDVGTFPDFIMLRGKKELRVELETLSSNFILHNHNPKKVDEVLCIKEDIKLSIPTRTVNRLKYVGGKIRISATVEKETKNLIKIILKNNNYRNISHIIETAIKDMAKEEKNVKKK
jgi:hypothetical protein